MAEANLKESGKDFFRDHNAKSYLFLGSAMCAMDKIPGKLLPNLLEYFLQLVQHMEISGPSSKPLVGCF